MEGKIKKYRILIFWKLYLDYWGWIRSIIKEQQNPCKLSNEKVVYFKIYKKLTKKVWGFSLKIWNTNLQQIGWKRLRNNKKRRRWEYDHLGIVRLVGRYLTIVDINHLILLIKEICFHYSIQLFCYNSKISKELIRLDLMMISFSLNLRLIKYLWYANLLSFIFFSTCFICLNILYSHSI